MLRFGPVIALTALALASPAAADPKQIALLHVNDTHSHLAAWGPKDASLDGTLGGLEKAATVIAAEKAANPHVLFVHAGDLIHGDPFFNAYLGVPELLFLEQLGLDVFTPGNHEFQFGPELLAGVLNTAWPGGGGVSIVGTNLDLSGYPVLGLWIASTAMKDAGGVKVGFVGLTTPWDPLEIPSPVVIREDLAPITQAAVDQLRSDGAEIVVCLAHLGLEHSRELGQAVSGLDVIVQGHDHVVLAQPEVLAGKGGDTLLVAAGSYYRWVGRLRLAVDAGAVSLVDYALIGVDEKTPRLPDLQPAMDALRAGILGRFGDIYHDALAWADEAIPNGSDPDHKSRDTAVGDLFTDAYRSATGTDVAIELDGFLDEGLPAGAIVGADLFRSMSYGIPNIDPESGYVVRPARLATFNILGADLLQALELCLYQGGALFPQVSGLRVEYDSSQPPMSRVLSGKVHVAGTKLDPARRYSVTANEVLVMYLPAFGVPVDDVTILPGSAWAAVKALVDARGVLEADTSGRIRDVAARR